MPGDLDSKTWLIIASAALVMILLLAAIAIIFIRRIYYGSGSRRASVPFTLEDLEKMHETGQISEQEYKTLRSTIIQKL